MATPRYQLIDPENLGFYHIVSRCTRGAWLCGYDRKTKKNYNHRKKWIEDRMAQLAPNFTLNIHAYTIMSNHFHLVVEYDPKGSSEWSDQETAERWYNVYPPTLADGSVDEGLKEFLIEDMLENKKLLLKARSDLSSISLFMQLLKQPIARRANLEDGVTGHFWDKPYYSGALLSDEAVLASMAYVDLNPVRAKITRHLKNCKATSIRQRIEDAKGHQHALEEYLEPLLKGLDSSCAPKISFRNYVQRLEELILPTPGKETSDKTKRWREQVALIKKRQRAFGPIDQLKDWIESRGMQLRELPLP